MKIKYIGHACFLLTTEKGIRIMTDPYEPGAYDGAVKYRPACEPADVVLVSHGHPDHCHVQSVEGEPRVVEAAGTCSFDGVQVQGIDTFHDTSGGSERGSNIIFRVKADGLTICHLGDLGHTLDEETAGRIRPVDVLMIPVGGFFTVGNEEADAIIDSLGPKLVIPMHFKTEGVDFPIAPVDTFLAGRKGVERRESSEVILSPGNLPEGILVLTPANLP